jgi:hypothetical protein
MDRCTAPTSRVTPARVEAIVRIGSTVTVLANDSCALVAIRTPASQRSRTFSAPPHGASAVRPRTLISPSNSTSELVADAGGRHRREL